MPAWVATAVLTASVATALTAPLALKWQLGAGRCATFTALVGVLLGAAAARADPHLPLAASTAIATLATLAAAAGLVAYRFYRDPERSIPAQADGLVLSPADGRVVYVRRSQEGRLPVATKHGRDYRLEELTGTELVSQDAVIVGIAMNFLDVHVNRAPIRGTVTRRRHLNGRFESLRKPEAIFQNERATTVIEQDGMQIAVVQIASRLVRQIKGFVKEGSPVAPGQRIGVIRLGSQVDVVLPARADVTVTAKPGDRVTAGESVIAVRAAVPTKPAGAVVLGSDVRALGVIRSLGRHGIRCVVVDHQRRAAWFSKHAWRRVVAPAGISGDELATFLREMAQTEHLQDWLLIPLQDDDVEAVARNRESLEESYRLVTPAWSTVRWALDKRLTNQLADSVGVARPRTWTVSSDTELDRLDVEFPVIVKPVLSAQMQQVLRLKAIAAADPADLHSAFRRVAGFAGPDATIVQELIPGGGETQFSVAALCRDGEVLAAMTARRSRQYPIDFGLSSSFVEAVETPGLIAEASKLIRALGYSGVIEVEFKRDPRTGEDKLLDLNLRPWGWHSLCAACGLDFPYLEYLSVAGEELPPLAVRYGPRWRRLVTDVPAALQEIGRGRLSAIDYIRSYGGTTVASSFSLQDPLPGLADMVTSLGRILRFRIRSGRTGTEPGTRAS